MNKALKPFLWDLSKNEQSCLKKMQSGNLVMENVPVHKFPAPGSHITVSGGARFQQYAEHTHDFIEMIYIHSGTNTHFVNGDKIHHRPGELLLLNQNTKHERLASQENDITVIFKFLPRSLDIPLAILGSENIRLRAFLKNCMQHENQQGDYLHLKTTDEYQVKNLIENLSTALFFEQQYKRDTVPFTMGLLFLHLANHMNQTHVDTEQSELLSKVLQYIEERYADGSLSDLAKKLHYDASWLSKDIVRLTGSTYTQLLQSQRISIAKLMLGTTDLPITEIAHQVGYANTSHFYKLFHKQTGISPRDYKKSQ